ncbi:MAG: diaminopimelate epimerase [Saprospiraceae bacterium]|nr:diaminopimelate epimerase [Saprospiraceae bacterium]
MTIPFYKYQGTGNDFVMIDQRDTQYLKKTDTDIIRQLCDRRFGIGGDGLMFLQRKEGYDFEMVYFNADGTEGSMCGNGGRCLTAFAHFLGVFTEKCTFLAIDGDHEAVVRGSVNNPQLGTSLWVELKMIDVPQKGIEQGNDYFLMNTGSPHYVVFVEDLTDINVYDNGRAIRYSERFAKEGVNVNFVEKTQFTTLKGSEEQGIEVATYERGVEDETFSCGTGVTAAAISYFLNNGAKTEVPIKTKGGQLEVKFTKNTVQRTPMESGVFENVWLCGPATRVFGGSIEI